jgi:hypothetical protein
MNTSLLTCSSVSLREGCELRYRVNDSDSIDFIISDDAQIFELECQARALQTLVALGLRALAEMSALRDREQLDGIPAQATCPSG